MPVKIQCPNPACGKAGSIADDFAGKAVRCRYCKTRFAVPSRGQVEETDERTRPTAAQNSEEIGEEQSSRDSQADGGMETDPGRNPQEEITQSIPGRKLDSREWNFLAAAEEPDEIGRLGPYRVLKVLGSGGMGVVFLAEDCLLERMVALKALLPRQAALPLSKQRFFREAKAAAALKHPHIVTIHQVGEDRGVPYLAMELLDGETLEDKLKRGVGLPVPDILRLGRQIAAGLSAAHERGLMHRDIKPANIWLETTSAEPSAGTVGSVKILDFGLARTVSEEGQLTQAGAVIGTPGYMAPEQARGEELDHRCDLFSLGCVLYHMCTGEAPFKGKNTISILTALALQSPEPPVNLDAAVPPRLSELVMHLLAKSPDQRPDSARMVLDELQEIEGQFVDRRARTKGRAPSAQESPSSRTAVPTTAVPRAERSGHAGTRTLAGNKQDTIVQDELRPRREFKPEPKEEAVGLGEGDQLRLAGPLGIGSLLLLLLAFSFSWTWFHRSANGFPYSVSGLGTITAGRLEAYIHDENFARQGQIHLGLSLAVAIMVVIGYIVACSATRMSAALAGKVLFGMVLTAAAWGTLNSVCMAGFIWTTFRSSLTSPGFGLCLGCALAIGIAVLFATTALRWEQPFWLAISQETACLIGWWELSVEPALRPAQDGFLWVVFFVLNGIFFVTAYWYLVHFADKADRFTGFCILGMQVVIAGISLISRPWRCAETVAVVAMQAYLAIAYPFKQQLNKQPPSVVEFGGFFAVQGLAFVVLFVVFMPTAAPPHSLNGTWVVERMQVGGRDEPNAAGITWIIDGDRLTTNGKTEGTIKTDRSKNPPTIDVVESAEIAASGIFNLDGDVLKICFGTKGGNRPVELSSTSDNQQSLVIMKRQKP